MPESDYTQFLEKLRSAPPTTGTKRLAQLLGDVPPADDGLSIVDLLYALERAPSELSTSRAEFVREIVSAKELGTAEDSTYNSKTCEVRLHQLLATETILATFRACDLQFEYDTVYQACRVLTDLRPVFKSAETDCAGLMVIHNLRITCRVHGRRGEIEDLFVALDETDLASLRKALDRAEQKARELKAIVKAANQQIIE